MHVSERTPFTFLLHDASRSTSSLSKLSSFHNGKYAQISVYCWSKFAKTSFPFSRAKGFQNEKRRLLRLVSDVERFCDATFSSTRAIRRNSFVLRKFEVQSRSNGYGLLCSRGVGPWRRGKGPSWNCSKSPGSWRRGKRPRQWHVTSGTGRGLQALGLAACFRVCTLDLSF